MLDLSITSISFLTLSFSFYLFLYFILRSTFHHHMRTPCPESYPIIGNLIGFLHNRHRFHDWVTDLLSATPSLTIQVNGFLGLSHGICTVNPANLDCLLHSNFPNYVKGSRFESVLEDLLGHGIFNVDGELWSTQRKIASHEFNTKSLRQFISNTVQFQLTNNLIPFLAAACDEKEVLDLQDIFCKFAFGNICNVAFGVDIASLGSSKTEQDLLNSSFIHAFDYALEVCSNRLMSIPAIWKIKKSLNIGSEKRYKEAIALIDDYAMKIIWAKERESETKEWKEEEHNHDLLSRFMFSTSNVEFHNQDEKRKFLRDIVISFIMAGKDSTSTALTWFFWLLSGHPRCELLIYEELSAAIITSSHSWPGGFSFDGLKKLHYLHAALSESLRLFPPVPINSRLTLADDILSDGTHVRRGWFADYSAYAMGRMERLWGPDCREYRPERWLDDDGFFQPCDQFKFPVFHCGPRMCLGKEMAFVQMKSIAAALIHEFQIEAVDGGGYAERMINPPYTLSLLLKMRGGLPVRIKRR
uniref:Cytochrome P450 n=1 Tax=Nothapodytes nimmoniana TaxID=159386 RepID=A0A7L7RBF5_NOTNI|nr:cytochrome P450 [Nothapodytes nimmoniana]